MHAVPWIVHVMYVIYVHAVQGSVIENCWSIYARFNLSNSKEKFYQKYIDKNMQVDYNYLIH